jgi:hypothetical protein
VLDERSTDVAPEIDVAEADRRRHQEHLGETNDGRSACSL